ncbi:SOS response-associated peptidase [Altererythrobacter lauratis]|uniref:Abasic site processing protein n=1 Tax=Alteraurantiacibacter lauratis TaxID=2054627 RepID=A0ABV7EEV9_9SPHN
MCNLYRMTKPAAEVAGFFADIAAELRVIPGNVPEQVYPGYPGLVLAQGTVRPMAWGFPLSLTGAKGQKLKPKPVNNARSDKLGSPFWAASFRDRRCLVPVSAFAEAEGPKGGKTRIWFSLPDAPLMAIGGLWRPSAEWGDCFTMVMTKASPAVSFLHDRMPVILRRADWRAWLDGSPQEALALCRPYAGHLAVDHTGEPWAGKR